MTKLLVANVAVLMGLLALTAFLAKNMVVIHAAGHAFGITVL